MAFPTSPLPLAVGLAAGANPVSPSTWNFADITADVREAGNVVIQVGAQNEYSQADATQVRMTLENGAGKFSRTNPLGTWFGRLDKGSPLRVAVTRIADTFTRTTSPGWGTEPNSGLTWAHTSSSAWSTNGTVGQYTASAANTADWAIMNSAAGHDVEVTSTASVPAVMTGAAWVHAIAVRRVDSSNYYRLHTEFGVGGVIAVKIVRAAAAVETTLFATTSTGISYSAGTRVCTRVRALGAVLQIRCWLESGSEPTTWHAQVEDSTVQGTSLGCYEWRVTGNSNAGSVSVSVDNFRADVIRGTTPVPEWPVRWDLSGRSVTAPIAGAGILRRLAQGQPDISSPIYQQLVAQPGAAYWPLEDGSDSSSASNAVIGGNGASGSGVSFGSSDCPPGASSAATLATGGSSYIQGRVRSWTLPTDGYAAMAYFRLPTLPASGAPAYANRIMAVNAVGTVVRWIIYATSTGFYVEGYKDDGTLQVNVGSFTYGIDPTKWFALQLETQESGSTVNWSLIWHQVGSTSFTSGAGSYSGTADRATAGALIAPVDGTLISHWWLGDDLLPFVDGTFMQVSAGYAGETAGARLARLFTQAGIPFALTGTAASTAPMGAQKSGTVLSLARDCEAADQGTLIERGAGLGYVTRASRYNQAPVMTLDFNSGHIAAPPEPTDDDQRLRNRITLNRSGGGSVRVEDTDSIAASGAYEDTLTVNLQADTALNYHAYWRLHLGTLDDLRWPKISLNLARNPNLIASWCSVRVGSRITVANPPAAVANGQALDLIVEGWTETLGIYRWDVELVCSPARPWDVGQFGAARYDSGATTLQSAVTAGASSLTLTFPTLSDGWSTQASDQPYDLLISGAQIRVPLAGMGAVTGAGPYTQTITGAAWVNGISKNLAAGAEVHVANPGRYAL